MATNLLSANPARRRTPGSTRLARWLDTVGAPLLLAAVVVVMALAGYESAAGHGVPEATLARNIAE